MTSSDESSELSSGHSDCKNGKDYFPTYKLEKYAHLYNPNKAEEDHVNEMNKINQLDLKLQDIMVDC